MEKERKEEEREDEERLKKDEDGSSVHIDSCPESEACDGVLIQLIQRWLLLSFSHCSFVGKSLPKSNQENLIKI